MPLREALRGLRHVLRKGGQTFADTVSTDGMPKPAATLANAVLREAGGILRSLDTVTSGFAKSVLGGDSTGAVHLADLSQSKGADARFAQAVYVALRSVLGQLGAPDVFISEAAARSVYLQTARRAEDNPALLAANLTLDLLSARVLRGTTAHQAARIPAAAIEPVAVFAVMLWLQSHRSDTENAAALDAASDLAIAIAEDIARACADRNADRIAELYEKYAPHV